MNLMDAPLRQGSFASKWQVSSSLMQGASLYAPQPGVDTVMSCLPTLSWPVHNDVCALPPCLNVLRLNTLWCR